MKYARLGLLCLFCAFMLALPASGQNGPVFTFDVTGAGTGFNQGTFPFAITPSGEITGYFLDSNNVGHGFIRSASGTITTFDAPGAGAGAYQGTSPFSISPDGTIVGYYEDPNCVQHGFERKQNGTISSFDVPGAGAAPGVCLSFNPYDTEGTAAVAINAPGEIAGLIVDTNLVAHGFVRTKDGVSTTFDAPGAGTMAFQGTNPGIVSGLNNRGVLIGISLDANTAYHGFVRTTEGEITSIDITGAGTEPFQGTQALSINSQGQIVGSYIDSANVEHAFLRAPDGSVTTFDVAGAGTGAFQGSAAEMNNDAGLIIGFYIDANFGYHGFLRNPRGEITTFDAPGAGTGGGLGTLQGTLPVSINGQGTITGYFIDANSVVHGFVAFANSLCDK